MTPEERKAFWARMNEEKDRPSTRRLWNPEAFGLKTLTHANRVQQDWAKLCEAETVHEYPVNYDSLNLTTEDVKFLTAVGIDPS
jgi:acyl-ACP thioesterase